ncbi:uncharacterized protein LOC144445480 [Glandiceps talaboti]
MAKFRKKTDQINKGNHSFNPDRARAAKGKGGVNMRDKSTINRLKMYRGGKPVRNRDGRIVKAAAFQGWVPCGTVSRVEPNRRWFGNTRVVGQSSLQTFQEEMGKVMKDPYQVVMRQTKLPITLLQEKAKHARVHLLDTESFETTFGKKKQRKRPNLKVADMESLVKTAEESGDKYDEEKDRDLEREDEGIRDEAKEPIFNKGTSSRIWGELYKVIDSSDVVIQVLDARDPQGTRCRHIEQFMTREKKYKHLIFVLNKVDLVPTWVTQRWVAILSQEFPTLAVHASVTNPFGKGALIQLLRQFAKLHQDKRQISVGFIGYPNVGKSSIINTLRKKRVCKVAPIAGETKVWQYITLMRRIFLIDCPGVVYPTGETETELVLKGVVRVENIKNPEDYIGAVLERVKPEYIQRTYRIAEWTDPEDFLDKMARRTGKLLKGAEPDVSTVAKMVLNDWQRGKIPFFVKPPNMDIQDEKKKIVKNSDKEIVTEKSEKDEQMQTEENNEEKSVKDTEKVGVVQDLRKIHVEPEFIEDDIEDLVPIETTEEDLENEEEEEEEDDEVVMECHSNQLKGKKTKKKSDLIVEGDNLSQGVNTFLGGKRTNKQRLAGLEIKAWSRTNSEKERKEKTKTEVKKQQPRSKKIKSKDTPDDIEVEYANSSEATNSQPIREGDSDHDNSGDTAEHQPQDGDLVDDGEFEVKETEHVTMVEMTPTSKRKEKNFSKKRKRYFEEDEYEEEPQPSKKELRKEHKKKMKQKSGQRYYDKVNVKNKNYKKNV